jgi:hypothetical protein
MQMLFTIHLQNVSAWLIMSMKFTKIKTNYELVLRWGNKSQTLLTRGHYEKLSVAQAVKRFSLFMNPKAH